MRRVRHSWLLVVACLGLCFALDQQRLIRKEGRSPAPAFAGSDTGVSPSAEGEPRRHKDLARFILSRVIARHGQRGGAHEAAAESGDQYGLPNGPTSAGTPQSTELRTVAVGAAAQTMEEYTAVHEEEAEQETDFRDHDTPVRVTHISADGSIDTDLKAARSAGHGKLLVQEESASERSGQTPSDNEATNAAIATGAMGGPTAVDGSAPAVVTLPNPAASTTPSSGGFNIGMDLIVGLIVVIAVLFGVVLFTLNSIERPGARGAQPASTRPSSYRRSRTGGSSRPGSPRAGSSFQKGGLNSSSNGTNGSNGSGESGDSHREQGSGSTDPASAGA